MTKNIEWLRVEVHKELESWIDVEGGINGYVINDIMLLINQLDEPETKELEQRISVLENELKILDSQNMATQIAYDEEVKSLELQLEKSNNKITDLEYELFMEKTREPKNKFYWFTAKKIPLIVDVSYTNNENDFYGFKQVPNYHFIEPF